MNDLSGLVARYKATLTTYTDVQYVPIATDKYGRIVFSHNESGVSGTPFYSSTRIGDGVDELSVLKIGDSVSGETGLMVFGQNQSGNAQAIPINNNTVVVSIAQPVGVSGNIDLDPTPGTDANKASDEGGAQVEPGVIPAIGTGSYVDIVSIPITSGEIVIQSVQMSCDRTCQFRLVLVDNTTITKYLGNWVVYQGNPSIEMTFPRAKEIVGQALRTVKLQAIRRAVGSADANCSGEISAFTR